MWNHVIESVKQRPPRILVVGDVMLDRYTWGKVERISPEAPVPVLSIEREEVRLGGAASVAMLARGLGAKAQLAGVVGVDTASTVLRRLLGEARIGDATVCKDRKRPTTSKERLLGHTDGRDCAHLLRIDRENCEPIGPGIERHILSGIERTLSKTDVVLVSDYAKGVCTPSLLHGLFELCRNANVPVLVDPARRKDYERYRGATLLKPNRSAAELASGRIIGSIEEARQAARQLCDQFDLHSAVVTLDRDGMVACDWDSEPVHIPAAVSQVRDITGAGDMMLAALGCGWGLKLSETESLELARLAAAIQIERLGVEEVRLEEVQSRAVGAQVDSEKVVGIERLKAVVEEAHTAGKQVVMANGCFDLLHFGHVSCLRQAAALGNMLIVAINSDCSVAEAKGPSRPIIRESERAAMLASLACVDYVVVFSEPTPHRLLEALKPDVLVKGGTYSQEEVVGKEIVESYGGRACVVDRVPDCSTTTLVKRIASSAVTPSASESVREGELACA